METVAQSPVKRIDFYNPKKSKNPHDLIKNIPEEYLDNILDYVKMKCLEQKYNCLDNYKHYNDSPEYFYNEGIILSSPDPFFEIKYESEGGSRLRHQLTFDR